MLRIVYFVLRHFRWHILLLNIQGDEGLVTNTWDWKWQCSTFTCLKDQCYNYLANNIRLLVLNLMPLIFLQSPCSFHVNSMILAWNESPKITPPLPMLLCKSTYLTSLTSAVPSYFACLGTVLPLNQTNIQKIWFCCTWSCLTLKLSWSIFFWQCFSVLLLQCHNTSTTSSMKPSPHNPK